MKQGLLSGTVATLPQSSFFGEVRVGPGLCSKRAPAGVVELDLGCLSPKGWKRNGGEVLCEFGILLCL